MLVFNWSLSEEPWVIAQFVVFWRVLDLRDCMHLKEVEVGRLLTAVLTGDFCSDCSSHWRLQCLSLKQLSEERPYIDFDSRVPFRRKSCRHRAMIASDSYYISTLSGLSCCSQTPCLRVQQKAATIVIRAVEMRMVEMLVILYMRRAHLVLKRSDMVIAEDGGRIRGWI
ncbi:hypothetical protein Ancab_021583 [Ancistrocladus abbreviatus]